jgi:hypothetical protein
MKGLARLLVGAVVWAGGLAVAQQVTPAAGNNTPAVAAQPAEAKIIANPAIWRVKGAHGTVYLFGSVHVMKPNVEWESAKVKAALTASDVIYLEIANLDDTAAAQPLAMQFGLDLQHPLSSKISKDDLAILDAAAKSMGMPGEAMLEPMQPWLVSATLEVVPMLKAGYDPASGIDTRLLAESRGENKSIKGFETMEEQIHMLADEPIDQQVTELHRQLSELDKSAAEINDLVAAWEHGDVEKIGRIDNDELAAKYPAQYKRIVVDRNIRWAATLDGLLKAPDTGTVFVTVGAAHLAGPDSVLKMLEKNGYKVERE